MTNQPKPPQATAATETISDKVCHPTLAERARLMRDVMIRNINYHTAREQPGQTRRSGVSPITMQLIPTSQKLKAGYDLDTQTLGV